jgi:hypothetical protein
MKRTVLFGAVLAALAPSALLAEMNYTNFEVSMIDVEVGQGFNVDGSREDLG